MRSGSDDLMRQSGYVTAAEVAEAIGQAVTSVKRAVNDRRIPGKVVPTSAKYSRHYVDIRALLAAGNYAGNDVALANLRKLAELVPKPAEKPAARRARA